MELKNVIELLEKWGSEEKIQKYQGLSYDRYDRILSENKVQELINLLIDKEHLSMFEFQGITIKVVAPIYVQRQWMRHRLFSYHEISRRYTKIKIDDLLPLRQLYTDEIYKELEHQVTYYTYLVEELKYKPEIQRGVIGTQFPTTFICSGNLRVWFNFLKLRMDQHQQQEIRDYAVYIYNDILKKEFPIIFNTLFRIGS